MFIGLLAFVFLFSLFLPSVGHTERAGVIDAPLDTVMSRLTDVHLLARWMQGWSTDSVDRNLEFQFIEDTSDQQACFSWYHRGLTHRSGSFCITRISHNRQVDYRMDMPGLPFITGHFVVAPALDNTHTWIKWTMDMQLGWWPWWKYYGVMLDRLVGPGMEHALGSLKADCEQADTLGYQIHRIPLPFHTILVIADTILASKISGPAAGQSIAGEADAGTGIISTGSPDCPVFTPPRFDAGNACGHSRNMACPSRYEADGRSATSEVPFAHHARRWICTGCHDAGSRQQDSRSISRIATLLAETTSSIARRPVGTISRQFTGERYLAFVGESVLASILSFYVLCNNQSPNA